MVYHLVVIASSLGASLLRRSPYTWEVILRRYAFVTSVAGSAVLWLECCRWWQILISSIPGLENIALMLFELFLINYWASHNVSGNLVYIPIHVYPLELLLADEMIILRVSHYLAGVNITDFFILATRSFCDAFHYILTSLRWSTSKSSRSGWLESIAATRTFELENFSWGLNFRAKNHFVIA